MALATVTYRYTAVLGPIKLEVINVASATDTNTVTTNMQRPLFAFGTVNTDATAQTVALNVGISGKTLTINQANLSAKEVTILCFGF